MITYRVVHVSPQVRQGKQSSSCPQSNTCPRSRAWLCHELFHLGIDTYVDRKNQRSGDWDQIGGYMGSTEAKFYDNSTWLTELTF